MNEALEKRLEDHMDTDDKNFDRIATAIEKVIEGQAAMALLSQRIGKVETNQEWLMKWFWLMATSAVGGVTTAVGTLIFVVLKLK